MKSKITVFLTLVILSSMILAGCQPKYVARTGLLWTKDLRQAVAAAIDREAIVDRVFEGRNIPAYSTIPDGFASAKPSFMDKYGTRNLQMAKDLLKAAGYSTKNKFVFDLWYPPDHYGVETVDVMQVVKEQIEETGMATVNFQTQNWAEYVDSFVAGQIPFFILGWFPDFVDEETWTSPWADCEQSKGNGVFYCQPEMQALLEKARSETDTAKRIDDYKAVQDKFAEEVPIIPLFWEPEFITYRNGVQGVTIGAPFEFNYNVLSFAADYTPASGSKDTIIIGTTDAVNSLDPQDAYSTHDWEILKNTGRALLGYTPGTAEIIPAAADSYEVSTDGLTYTFHLNHNIKFADGTPMTASIYKTIFDRWGLGGQVGFLPLTYVASVEAPDDYTVVYHTTGAYGFFPAIAATAPFVPANPKDIPDTEIKQIPDVIDGIGPYKLVSYKAGEQAVLEANDNYFGADKAIIKQVIIKYFADPATMANAVESGQIDIAWRILGPVEATRLKSVSGLTVMTVNAPALRYLVFQCSYEIPAVTK
jgi:peptide/nickel transport system substrate-binding protein